MTASMPPLLGGSDAAAGREAPADAPAAARARTVGARRRAGPHGHVRVGCQRRGPLHCGRPPTLPADATAARRCGRRGGVGACTLRTAAARSLSASGAPYSDASPCRCRASTVRPRQVPPVTCHRGSPPTSARRRPTHRGATPPRRSSRRTHVPARQRRGTGSRCARYLTPPRSRLAVAGRGAVSERSLTYTGRPKINDPVTPP